ncbi:MAG: hypothetical protein K9I99_10485 [Melioribacteraceae bacterium]|nr:hypothetical protein [Melioribacteraceae bacterium]MCF8430725.1 hypothetical protein [Melioribacteraceae bacterium]
MKLIDLDNTISIVVGYNIIEESLVSYTIIALSLLELVLSMFLTLNIYQKETKAIIIILFGAFFILNISAVILGGNYFCACFGGFFEIKMNYLTVIRDGFLFLLSIYIWNHNDVLLDYDNMGKATKNITEIIILSLYIIIALYNYINRETSLDHGDYLEPMKVHNLEGNSVVISYDITTLILIFKMSDCNSCLADAFRWNEYKRYNKNIKLVILGYDENIRTVQLFAKQKQLTDVYFDRNARIIDSFRLITPARIIVDEYSKVIHLSKINGDLESHKKFLAELGQLANL